jgi:hypothetical protein
MPFISRRRRSSQEIKKFQPTAPGRLLIKPDYGLQNVRTKSQISNDISTECGD